MCGHIEGLFFKRLNLQALDVEPDVLLLQYYGGSSFDQSAALKIAAVLVFMGPMTNSSGFSKWASSRANHTQDLD